MKTLPYILLAFILFSCKKEKKNVVPKKVIEVFDGYTLTGKSIFKEGYVYLLNNKKEKTDSIAINNHNFILKGKVDYPELFYLQIENSENQFPIIVENTSFDLFIDNSKTIIIGGKLNTVFNDYYNKKLALNNKSLKYYEHYKSNDITLKKYIARLDENKKIEKQSFNNFLVANKNNLLSPIVLNETKVTSKEAIKIRKQLNESKNTALLSDIDTLIKNLKNEEARNKILRRKPATLFSGVNQFGRKSSLSSVLKNKKLVLIDFWASWCPPCREASPKLISLHDKYNRKGFDILSVSEDRSVAEWENGIYLDNLEQWNHIYDDYNRISNLYGVTSLPHFVLIDENGKIIKNKISLKDLELIIQKTFKE